MVFSYPLSVYFLKFIAGEILWENAARWDVQYNYYVINKKSQAQMANIGRLRYPLPSYHIHTQTHTHTHTQTHAQPIQSICQCRVLLAALPHFPKAMRVST